ncbi:DUF4279 domain-containing protein [Thiofilum flexile]|uniref:DUF4279 domain-containing protein n=1 Tax=Thiofilum flexile TaxID=125627 RepID=UPI00039C943C|nr:DUF4279 domain-containing protein [Thiofilum flexile]
MAGLARSLASLRIAGDDLDPNEITALLGHIPTTQQVKGEVIVGKVTRQVRTVKIGMWRLKATESLPADLDQQIDEVLSKLTPDLSVWEQLSTRYHMDLFCGLFMVESNEGLSISAKSMKALGERGIELGLDIYAPDPEDETDS